MQRKLRRSQRREKEKRQRKILERFKRNSGKEIVEKLEKMKFKKSKGKEELRSKKIMA